jgi:hypothetical protein
LVRETETIGAETESTGGLASVVIGDCFFVLEWWFMGFSSIVETHA